MSEALKYLMLLLIAGAAAFGQYLLKIGLEGVQLSTDSPFRFLQSLIKLCTNFTIWSATGLYLLALILYMILLIRLDVSRLYPISQGLNFILVTVVAWLFLHESVNTGRLVGLGFIILGIYLVDRF